MKNCFVIINYNDSKTVIKLLNNIRNYKIIDEILIVDNNSIDDSFEILKKEEDDHIKIIRNSSNKGYGSGINFGCLYLKEKYGNCNVIISNADIIINSENDLITLISYLKDDIAVVGPTINEHGVLNRGWKIPTPLKDSLLNLPYFYKLLKPKLLLYKNDYYQDEVSYVEAVSGCFFLSTIGTLDKINYFDENVFLYYEENILGVKLKKINKKTIIINNIEVIHDHSITIDKNINKYNKFKTLKQSEYYFQTKYNQANKIEKILLKTTIFLGKIVQYIICR